MRAPAPAPASPHPQTLPLLTPPPLPPLPPCRVAAADSDLTQEELEAQLEAFMRRQAEIESGGAARKAEPGKVLGADEVSDEVRWAGGEAGGWRQGAGGAAPRAAALDAAAARGRRPGAPTGHPSPARGSAPERRRPSACAARSWRC